MLAFSFLLAFPSLLHGQWRGPERDGHFPGNNILKAWPEGGPELVYEVSGFGEGFSSPVVYNGNIYLTGKIDSLDVLSMLSMEGELKWQEPYGTAWQKSYTSSRSSPSLENGRAYLLSGTGELVCLEISTRKVIWSANVDSTYGAIWDTHGIAETLLLVDSLVVCTPSGPQTTMVAFNKHDGQVVWETVPLGGRRSYASPTLYEHGNIRQILGATTWSYFAVDPATGRIMWNFPYYKLGDRNTDRGTLITFTPIYRDDEIFISTGYNYPAVLLRVSVDGNTVTEKWRCPSFDNHHGHVVRVGNYLYGSNWHNNSQGDWICVDWESGKVMWEQDWYCKGSIITAGGMIYIYEERQGNVGLLKPDPRQFNLMGSFRIRVGTGPHWAHPVIHHPYLMIRHGDHLMVYRIGE
jgi:outer membrane protein assembly factor BamB